MISHIGIIARSGDFGRTWKWTIMIIVTLPFDACASSATDAVLHRLLIGPATPVPGRPAIADGGRLVPSYTASLEAAAALFDARFPGAAWQLHRASDQDALQVHAADHPALAATVRRGQGALALSLLILAVVQRIGTPAAWDGLVADVTALAADTEALRQIERL